MERWFIVMMIAFEKMLPNADAVHKLMNGTDEHNGFNLRTQVDRFASQPAPVVAAYDGEQLIAIGGFASNAEMGEEFTLAVHPAYAERDIAANMKKLLKSC